MMDFLERNALIQILLWSSCLHLIWATSLPLGTRSRQLLLYPSQNIATNGQLQLPSNPFVQIPYASASHRIDINQRGPFLGSAQNPNELFLLYPQNGPIPGSAQSPAFNEIYPNVQFNPALQPGRPGGAGFQPEIEPDAVLISTSPNGQGGVVVQDSQQPNPNPDENNSGYFPGGYPAVIGSVINWFGYGPESESENQPDKNKRPAGPIKNESELSESSEETNKNENTDKPITAGEQEVLAAADKNPEAFPAKPNKTPSLHPNLGPKTPGLKPGQRFYILNGQPQFYSVPPALGQPFNPIYQNNLLYYRNIQGLPSQGQHLTPQPQLFQQPNLQQQDNPFLLPQIPSNSKNVFGLKEEVQENPQEFRQPNSRQRENPYIFRQIPSNSKNVFVLKGDVQEDPQQFRLAHPQVFPVQLAGGNEKITNPFGQIVLLRTQPQLGRTGESQLAGINQPEVGRQLGAPYLIRTLVPQGGRKSGPNPAETVENEQIKATNVEQSATNVEKTDAAAADVAALEFSRYLAQKQHQQRLQQATEGDKRAEESGSEIKS